MRKIPNKKALDKTPPDCTTTSALPANPQPRKIKDHVARTYPERSRRGPRPRAESTTNDGKEGEGDWGTPSEYVRELILQDKERRLVQLEQELLAAVKGTKIEVSLAEIRGKGLIAALRERTRRR
jgi:antitoxin ParD1/3/4